MNSCLVVPSVEYISDKYVEMKKIRILSLISLKSKTCEGVILISYINSNLYYTCSFADISQASSFFIHGYKNFSVVVANENEDVRFTCEIDSNPASVVTIIFGNHIVKEERNTRSLSFSKIRLSCIDGGLKITLWNF